jgi:hypothetical protein
MVVEPGITIIDFICEEDMYFATSKLHVEISERVPSISTYTDLVKTVNENEYE